MLDLNARVHLQEVEHVAITIDEHFYCAQASIFQMPRKRNCRAMYLFAQRLTDIGCWRFFHKFLIAPLYRAVASAEMDDFFAVAENLHFDVTAVRNVTLDIQTRIAKTCLRLRHRHFHRSSELGSVAHLPHASAATTSHRFDEYRPADLSSKALCFVEAAHFASR